MLLSTSKVLTAALAEAEPDLTLDEILDRIVTIAAEAATLNDDTHFAQAVEALAKVYMSVFDPNGGQRKALNAEPAVVWRSVLERVEALGGLLVRLERFDLVRPLVLAVTDLTDIRPGRNWLRHGLTQASQAGAFHDQDSDGNERKINLLQRACTRPIRRTLCAQTSTRMKRHSSVASASSMLWQPSSPCVKRTESKVATSTRTSPPSTLRGHCLSSCGL